MSKGKNKVGYNQSNTPKQFNGRKSDDNQGWSRYRESQLSRMPEALPGDPGKRKVRVFVEGYEDVSFWRGIFDDYESKKLTFEVSVPPREDLAKGKKVILAMLQQSSPDTLLCVDSDFDYLFANTTEQANLVNNGSPYLFHTYAYASENFLCYAPSLHNVCVRATKNDTRIFDFEKFLSEYSETIYPLFLWYILSAWIRNENLFTLNEFKSSVKLNYLEVDDNGRDTIGWLGRQVGKRLEILERKYPEWKGQLPMMEKRLRERGVTPRMTYLFMQGHTVMDNVVMVMLGAVCEQLKLMSTIRINTSTKTGTALKNEMSNYNNSLRSVRDVLLDNEGYKECPLYRKLQKDIENYISKL